MKKISFVLGLVLVLFSCKKNDHETGAVHLTPPGNIQVTMSERTALITWNNVENATAYLVEVSDNPSFSNIVFTGTVHTNTASVPDLSYQTTYYYRVRAIGDENKIQSSMFITQIFSTGGAAESAIAFPGAEGYGRIATGGRGGRVIKVTNLNDAGTGSFRAAIEATGPRIIVFDVSGYIALNSPVRINNGDVTIAGQTAPGDGICIRNYEVNVNADNVIIRYMRFRLGDVTQRESDAIWGRYKRNIIIDHCSISWAIDEAGSFYGNENFTMQWCMLTESLNKSFHQKDDHGYGGIWGGRYASFHHNLLAHHNSRNPRLNGGLRAGIDPGPYPGEFLDYRNNVLYNWGDNSMYGGENGTYNVVNNYYRPGPGTPNSKNSRLLELSIAADVSSYPPGYGKFFLSGNVIHGNTGVSNDNWTGVLVRNGVDLAIAKLASAWNVTEIPTTHTAADAFERVLNYVGASLKRDAVDTRVIAEARNGTVTYYGSKTGKAGIIDSQEDVGGFPVLASVPALTDTDGDGMPDEWEIQNGLNPAVNDANGRKLSSVYDNIEVYINSLVQTITTQQNN
jgi:hypothetical protein